VSKNSISERQQVREKLDWILDMKRKDVDAIMRTELNREDPSMKMVYEDLGVEYCIGLWRTMKSMQLYISETRLNNLRRLYVRQNFNVTNPLGSAKELAVRLGVSEKFIYEALSDESKSDPRQIDAFEEKR
jgi:hypothetical protein